MIQNIFKCVKFTPNENLNKTCNNEKRCVIYNQELCYNYTEKEKEK